MQGHTVFPPKATNSSRSAFSSTITCALHHAGPVLQVECELRQAAQQLLAEVQDGYNAAGAGRAVGRGSGAGRSRIGMGAGLAGRVAGWEAASSTICVCNAQ